MLPVDTTKGLVLPCSSRRQVLIVRLGVFWSVLGLIGAECAGRRTQESSQCALTSRLVMVVFSPSGMAPAGCSLACCSLTFKPSAINLERAIMLVRSPSFHGTENVSSHIKKCVWLPDARLAFPPSLMLRIASQGCMAAEAVRHVRFIKAPKQNIFH